MKLKKSAFVFSIPPCIKTEKSAISWGISWAAMASVVANPMPGLVRKAAAIAIPSIKLCKPSPKRIKTADGCISCVSSWWWNQRTNLSRKKNTTIPKRTGMKILAPSAALSKASGKRSKNETASMVPAAKLKSVRVTFWEVKRSQYKKSAPTKAIRLTVRLAVTVKNNVDISKTLWDYP